MKKVRSQANGDELTDEGLPGELAALEELGAIGVPPVKKPPPQDREKKLALPWTCGRCSHVNKATSSVSSSACN